VFAELVGEVLEIVEVAGVEVTSVLQFITAANMAKPTTKERKILI